MQKVMLSQMKNMAIDAVGNADRRTSDLHVALKLSIERKYAAADDKSKLERLRTLCEARDTKHTGEISLFSFVSVLDDLGVKGSVDDKVALFERFDGCERGHLSIVELCEGVLGVRHVPTTNPDCRVLLRKLNEKIRRRGGVEGMRSFSRCIRLVDTGKGTVDPLELRSGMLRYGVDLPEDEYSRFVKLMDRAGDGCVDIAELLHGIRGRLSHRRRVTVKAAFGACSGGAEVVSLKDLLKVFDASKHPSVTAKQKTVKDVQGDFAEAWERDPECQISFSDFLDYYKDVSAMIDNDEEFERLVCDAWCLKTKALSWPKTATSLAVLVTFSDGNETVVDIPVNGPVSESNIRQTLGMKDIAKIEPYA